MSNSIIPENDCFESQMIDAILNGSFFEDKKNPVLDHEKHLFNILEELKDDLPDCLGEQQLENAAEITAATNQQQQLQNECNGNDDTFEEIKRHLFQNEDYDNAVSGKVKQEESILCVSVPNILEIASQALQFRQQQSNLPQQQTCPDIQCQIVPQTYQGSFQQPSVNQPMDITYHQPSNMIPSPPQQPLAAFNQMPLNIYYQQPANMAQVQPVIIVQAPASIPQPSYNQFHNQQPINMMESNAVQQSPVEMMQRQPINVFIQQSPGPTMPWNTHSVDKSQPQQMDKTATTASLNVENQFDFKANANESPTDLPINMDKAIRVNSENPNENPSLQNIRDFFKNYNPDAKVERLVPPKPKKTKPIKKVVSKVIPKRVPKGAKKEKQPARCELCSRNFSSIGYLKQHANAIHGEKIHFCDECGKGFPTETERDNHQERHGMEKPHKCQLCISSFMFPIDLHRHIVVSHTKNYKHRCTYCNKGFHRPCTMRNHMQNCKSKETNWEMMVKKMKVEP